MFAASAAAGLLQQPNYKVRQRVQVTLKPRWTDDRDSYNFPGCLPALPACKIVKQTCHPIPSPFVVRPKDFLLLTLQKRADVPT